MSESGPIFNPGGGDDELTIPEDAISGVDVPTAYPQGISFMLENYADESWPTGGNQNGFVLNFRKVSSDGYDMAGQLWFPAAEGGVPYVRIWDYAAGEWLEWQDLLTTLNADVRYIKRTDAAPLTQPLPTDVPADFKTGASTYSVAASDGWPADGLLVVFKGANANTRQVLYRLNANTTQTRYYSSGWSAWATYTAT